MFHSFTENVCYNEFIPFKGRKLVTVGTCVEGSYQFPVKANFINSEDGDIPLILYTNQAFVTSSHIISLGIGKSLNYEPFKTISGN